MQTNRDEPTDADADADVNGDLDVLIVGGGPVGLAARVLLERWGVRTLLVERHRELSPFPRSRLVNVRSMEILRQLGLAERVTAVAFPAKFGRIRFRDTLRGPDFATAAMVGVREPIPQSPVIGVVTSQDRLEPLLLGAAGGEVRFGTELVAVREDTDGVLADLADREHGTAARVRARYLLAADGAASTVRRLLGIGTYGPGALGRTTTVVFDADLADWSDRQPAGMYVTAHGSFLPLYPEGGWGWFGPTPEGVAHTDWAALVRGALGASDPLEVDVLRVQHWTMNAFVADRLREGRTLLAGDAAHAVPIVGGLGMNTGIGDVHNLCWKLAGVLQGWAAPALLDTYAPERHPVADRVLEQSVANTRLMAQVQSHRSAQLSADATLPPPGGTELPWTDQYFAQLGLVLGAVYDSEAVYGSEAGESPGATGATGATAATGATGATEARGDHGQAATDAAGDRGAAPTDATGAHGPTATDAAGARGAAPTDAAGALGPTATDAAGAHRTAPPNAAGPPGPTPTDYTPTPHPGHRLPHLWLTPTRSTLDALGEHFTLFTAGPPGEFPGIPWPLHVEPLTRPHAEALDLGPADALLVRPDGHVGARFTGSPLSPDTLATALTAITGGRRPD
ncbi:FAD-dependent monooxygenase [Streptomyces sp. NPDC048290]|uniref:FAD-dependent monooxygenase n=1 Tax=Streptomyces sp. NPDC048290 TaxID=3155811 RepID=UPI003437ED93